MGEREVRRRTVREHDVMDEGFEIPDVFVEAADVALARVAQCALRAALPAPVESRDREAARPQVADGLEIFLDELGAPLKQADRTFASRRRSPAAVTELESVGGRR